MYTRDGSGGFRPISGFSNTRRAGHPPTPAHPAPRHRPPATAPTPAGPAGRSPAHFTGPPGGPGDGSASPRHGGPGGGRVGRDRAVRERARPPRHDRPAAAPLSSSKTH